MRVIYGVPRWIYHDVDGTSRLLPAAGPPSGSGRGPGNVVNECYQGREYLRYLAMP